MHRFRHTFHLFLILLIHIPISIPAASPSPVAGKQGMVVCQHELATDVGVDILKSGGNAVDAAVATAFALGVTEPYHCGIGGGGFMIVKMRGQDPVVIDFREVAPQQAHRDMFLENGQVNPMLSRVGGLACAVPGEVAGLLSALDKFGVKERAEILTPSIEIAEQGFPLNHNDCEFIQYNIEKLRGFNETARIFLTPEGNTPEPASLLIQEDLARTYRQIAEEGEAAFYQGEIGEKITRHIQENGGIITMEDLAAYKVLTREPVRGVYRGYEVISMPPPSSGGVHLIQMLNILENSPIYWLGHNSTQKIHLVVQAMKAAFADRAYFLGDPDFVKIPVVGLLSKNYANMLSKRNHPILSTDIENHGEPQDFMRETDGHTSHHG
ncbi:MAG: hypothetical protein B6244_12630 [Candidatus Cloacimonetes bacterium 4572_55]|nr:MAG: hypothetical protein B6244_12630 [Candidatus Cloacimonetes bacterium 4572_55]